MLNNSKRPYLLADASKFNKISRVKVPTMKEGFGIINGIQLYDSGTTSVEAGLHLSCVNREGSP